MDDTLSIKLKLSGEEQSLRDQIGRTELVLDEFERELCEIDSERDEQAGKRHEYDLLLQVCNSLDELDDLGAAHLFWAQQDGGQIRAETLAYARRNMEVFGDDILRLEERRAVVFEKIGDQNLALDKLHYELREVMELEESRQAEWIVERDEDELPYRAAIMPWTRGTAEDQLFRVNVLASLFVALAVGWLISTIALPIPERAELIEVPERVAKLVEKERLAPPEPEPIDIPLPDEEIPEPEPELAEETPPEEVVPEAVDQPVVAEAAPEDTKEKVKSKGILAFRDSFAARANLNTTAQLGSQARLSNAGEDSVGRPQRMMVTTSAPGSSGGINLASISRDVGGGGQGIEGVQVSRVASSIGGGEGPDRPLSAGMSAGRTDEEIQIVFDRYKAALYRLYNKELRKDPTLRGQLVLRLTIEPDGSVSMCALQSSDMDAPTLAQQVVDRVSAFDFGAKDDIVAMTIIYPIDFLPAA
ncbi:MAG: AgmX/PglI C-terminal domain-containing protein [Gammaproteobacteria bacterium]